MIFGSTSKVPCFQGLLSLAKSFRHLAEIRLHIGRMFFSGHTTHFEAGLCFLTFRMRAERRCSTGFTFTLPHRAEL